MIIKQLKDHKVIQTRTCSEIWEILIRDDYLPELNENYFGLVK